MTYFRQNFGVYS